uniref:LIM zinc-binding domain-containing protein n=1 Tax=Meleagris gallopavo TaxID=9103 RepID=A0A803YJE1_MELGA
IDICYFCKKRVYVMERLSAEGHFFHRECFKCEICSTTLRLGIYAFDVEEGNTENGMFRSWALDVTYSLMLGARGLYGFFACFFSVQMEVSKLYKNSLAISK